MNGSSANTDLVVLFVKRWRTLLISTVLATTVAVVYALVAQEWYEARLAVVPSMASRELGAMALVSKLPGLDSTSPDSKRIEAVLTSVSVADEVIKKFDLRARYGADYQELARKALWKHCPTDVDRKSGVVTLTCEDTDPKIAMEMASYFGDVGNRVFGRISASSAREEANFLETQLAKARRDVDEASQQLRQFQEKHKIVDLPEQTKAVISAMASLKGELLSKQLELSYLRGFSARTEASVVQVQQQIEILESKLKQLEARASTGEKPAPTSAPASRDFFPDAMSVPELRFELELLLRDQQVKETVFALLTQRYETAKVDAARDTSTFQILDSPTLPTLRSRPVRRKVAALGVFGGIVLGAAWIAAPVWWRRRVRA